MGLLLLGHVHKPCELRPPAQVYGANGAVTLFGNNDLRHIGRICVFIIIIVPIQEHDHVRVLLDGSRLTQVRKHGPVVRPGFAGTGKLGQGDDRGVELTGQGL